MDGTVTSWTYSHAFRQFIAPAVHTNKNSAFEEAKKVYMGTHAGAIHSEDCVHMTPRDPDSHSYHTSVMKTFRLCKRLRRVAFGTATLKLSMYCPPYAMSDMTGHASPMSLPKHVS